MKRVLFLCGAMMNATIWESMIKELPYDPLLYTYSHEDVKQAQHIVDLVDAVASDLRGEVFDGIIAHSMGGVIALKLLEDHVIEAPILFMVETNLRPAKAFYRTFLMQQHKARLLPELQSIMEMERPFYQDTLLADIQEVFDYTPSLFTSSCEKHCVYGDRGQDGYAHRMEDLCLNQASIDALHLHFIKDSAHMPMLENTSDMIELCKEILERKDKHKRF